MKKLLIIVGMMLVAATAPAWAAERGQPAAAGTNPPATIAWGEATNGLQARVTLVLGQNKFLYREPLQFSMSLQAATEVRVWDYSHPSRWNLSLLPLSKAPAKSDPITIRYAREDERVAASFANPTLGKGWACAVELTITASGGWAYSPEQPASFLPPGLYRLTATYSHLAASGSHPTNPCPYWHGTATTGPLEFEIDPLDVMASGKALTLNAGVGGSTVPGGFEPGQAISIGGWFLNRTPERLAIKERSAPGELIFCITDPEGQKTEFDPVKDWQTRMLKQFTGLTAMTSAASNEFKALPPGGWTPLAGFVGLVDKEGRLAVNSQVGPLPAEGVAKPGTYEARVRWRNADPRGWLGEVVSDPFTFEVLSEARIADLEKGMAITRQQAQLDALAAAEEYFKSEAVRLKVSEPFRLIVQGQKKFWRVEYCRNDGLVAKWVVIQVDGATGKVTTERSGKCDGALRRSSSRTCPRRALPFLARQDHHRRGRDRDQARRTRDRRAAPGQAGGGSQGGDRAQAANRPRA